VRALLVSLISFPLLLVLALTTPTGTGQGAHRTMLLHPVFSHTHVVDGQVVSHHQLEISATTAESMADGGTSVGAAAGASVASHVVSVSTTPPLLNWRLQPDTSLRRAPVDALLPQGRVEPPPDPPPTFAA
jgi:hypothetical protein